MEPLNDQSTLSSISFISEDVPQTDSISQKPLADTKTDQLPKPLNSTFSNPHLHTSLVSSDLLSLTSDQLTDDAISFTSSSQFVHIFIAQPHLNKNLIYLFQYSWCFN